MKNASNLTGQVQKLLKKIESGVGPKFHNKDDHKESLWLWKHVVLRQWYVSYLMDKEMLSEGEVPIQSIISGDEDNGSLCHIKNEYKPIYSARRAYNYPFSKDEVRIIE